MSVCPDRKCGPAPASPYAECVQCRLDYDVETFFHKKYRDIIERRMINPRRRLIDTACKGCRRTEADAKKTLAPRSSQSLNLERALVKAENAISSHARRWNVPIRQFRRENHWSPDVIADALVRAFAEPCPVCGHWYIAEDDLTIDITLRDQAPIWLSNTRLM